MLRQVFLLFSITALLLAGPFVRPASAQDSLRIIAVVNEDIVTELDLYDRIKLVIFSSQLPDTAQTANRLAPRILQELILERLKTQEAKRLEITASDADIQNNLRIIEKQNKLPPGGVYAFLRSNKINKDTLLNQVEADILWRKVVNKTLRRSVIVSDDEVGDTLSAIQTYQGKPEFLLHEIFLPVETAKKANDAKNFADQLIEQMKGGTPFESLAKAFSRSANATSGGSMGWVRPDEIDNELRPVLAGLKPGQVSIPIPSLGGYRILYLKASRPAPGIGKSQESVTLEQIHIPLNPGTPEAAIAETMNKLRALSADAKTCTEFRNIGSKTGSALSGALGVIKTSNLPQAIAQAVQDLPDNTASQPILVEGGVIMLMVCERKSDGNGISQIRDRIRATLSNRRLGTAADKYLNDLRREAFVDIRI